MAGDVRTTDERRHMASQSVTDLTVTPRHRSLRGVI